MHHFINTFTVLTIPTAILGVFTIIAIIVRVWKLVQPSPGFRPLKSPRYALDIFQWGYFAALVIISALISSTLLRNDSDHDGHEFQIRLLSMPAPVLMYFLATLTLLSLVLNWLEVTLPFRFGSVDAGNVVRPAIYYIVEDVVAVDGDGGLEYRTAFTERYENSPIFQRMIQILSVVWCLAFFAIAAWFTVLVLILPVVAVYAVGWCGPFPLAGLLTIWTIFYVKSTLREERLQEDNEDGSVPDGLNGQTEQGGNETTPLLSSRL